MAPSVKSSNWQRFWRSLCRCEKRICSGKNDPQSQNQLIRWVTSKDEYAQNIIDTIANYYLTQRVKPEQADYVERLKNHHMVMLAAMKAKQSSSLKAVDNLNESLEKLRPYYPIHHE